MLKKFLLAAVVLMATTPYHDNLLPFERHHDRFVREYFGCPPTGEISNKTCKIENGRLNYGEFLAARKAAMKLYNIEECQTSINSR